MILGALRAFGVSVLFGALMGCGLFGPLASACHLVHGGDFHQALFLFVRHATVVIVIASMFGLILAGGVVVAANQPADAVSTNVPRLLSTDQGKRRAKWALYFLFAFSSVGSGCDIYVNNPSYNFIYTVTTSLIVSCLFIIAVFVAEYSWLQIKGHSSQATNGKASK